ncbi:hypothetical protein [Burkholderia sp. PU8-34]
MSVHSLGAFEFGGIVRVEIFDGQRSAVWAFDSNMGNLKMDCADADMAEFLVRVMGALLCAASLAECELARWDSQGPDMVRARVCSGLIADALSEVRVRERVNLSARAVLGDQEASL